MRKLFILEVHSPIDSEDWDELCVVEVPASKLKLPTLFFVECRTSLEILLLTDEFGVSETLLLVVFASDDENAAIRRIELSPSCSV